MNGTQTAAYSSYLLYQLKWQIKFIDTNSADDQGKSQYNLTNWRFESLKTDLARKLLRLQKLSTQFRNYRIAIIYIKFIQIILCKRFNTDFSYLCKKK